LLDVAYNEEQGTKNQEQIFHAAALGRSFVGKKPVGLMSGDVVAIG